MIDKKDGSIEEHHFTEEDGSIMLDPDVRKSWMISDCFMAWFRNDISPFFNMTQIFIA